MKTFDEIQVHIDKSFQDFIAQLFRLDADKLKYYYWTAEFFETIGDLSFTHYTLSQRQKESINAIGDFYFDDSDVYFSVNKNSHRHDILINNINKLFTDKYKSGQSKRYEYLKEYILWEILEKIAKTSKGVSSDTVEQQKKNFLSTYLQYLLEHTQKPSFKEFEDYIKYTLTNQGEELEKKLKDLDDKNVENKVLREKLSRLYILRQEESKLHFVFSRNQGGDKEELRELLEVMGREETGKLYRGQANSTWKLDSSLTRQEKYRIHEDEMYYEILSLKPDAFTNDHSVYERLITMQHFGMPTRLMDITRNPLVAIFFACNNLERADSDGVVYTFKRENKDFLNFEDERLKGLKHLFDKSYKLTDEQTEFLSDIAFIKGVAKNQRINNQSGDFIFVGKGGNIPEKLHYLPALTIIIDAPTKTVLLEQLESLNIHGGSVYPDLTHMSNYIRTKYLEEGKRTPKDFKMDLDLSRFEESKRTKPPSKPSKVVKKTSEVTQLTQKYDFAKFWTSEENAKLVKFAKSIKIPKSSLQPFIEDYLENDRLPGRKEIAELMVPKPRLVNYISQVQPVIDKIEAFAKKLDTNKK